jgi:hypothetical protein
MNDLRFYLEQYALRGLEKQEKFVSLVGEHSMELDLDTGLIRLSGGFEFSFQVLGTESDNTLTWLWAWADEQTEIPPELMTSAFETREWGAKAGIPECIAPSVDLTKANGHVFSLIASEITDASCYYQDSYDGGALFLLLFSQAIDGQPPLDAAGLVRQFSYLASLYDFNHRNAFASYFRQKGLPLTEHASFIVSRMESGEDIRANFDQSGGLISLNGKKITFGQEDASAG